MRSARVVRRGRLKKKLLAAKKVIDFQASIVRELNQEVNRLTQTNTITKEQKE